MKRYSGHILASGMIVFGLALASSPFATAQSSVVQVPPPQIMDYWVSASRQPGGVVVFDGYAPDAATRDMLANTTGADVSWLKLGTGAPQGYSAAVELGLNVLGRMSEGRFALRGTVLSVSGVAASQADFVSLHQSLASQAPAGIIIAMSEISAPRVESYAFAVRRQANGNTLISGFVPSPEVEARVLLAVGSRSSSTLRFASGEPLNFETLLDRAMPLFALLQEGEIQLDNGQWLLSGTPVTSTDAENIRDAFARNRFGEAGWSLALAPPSPVAPPAPYQWSAQKSAAGEISIAGSVPTEAMQRILALRLGGELGDETNVVSDTAPDGFITEALAASDALKLLESGRVTFDGAKWSIEGQGNSQTAAEDITAALPSEAEGWTVNVTNSPGSSPAVTTAAAPPEADLVAAAPVPAVAEPAPATRVASTASAAEGVNVCEARLAELSAQNGILFRSGAAVLADTAAPFLAAIAETLGACPAAAINVAGHTDSDGDADANLALSVARAEAVVSALINLGVSPERFYALGYGESQPVADNGSATGKAQNRRIVVSVRSGG